ncbi:MAG: hypothetical protein AB8G22_05165 [Saprospiraceae bacterium]
MRDPWQDKPIDSVAVLELYQKGEQLYENVNDEFIRMRCGYQLVRLAHYYQLDPVAAYEKFIQPLSAREDLLKYWAMEHKAGYLTKSEDSSERVEGNYLLAKVLGHCPERSHKIYRSFNIWRRSEWNACLRLCKNGKERAMLHYLRGLEDRSIYLEEIKAMYKYAPNIPEIEVMMLREMQKLESRFLGRDLNRGAHIQEGNEYVTPKSSPETYLKPAKEFIQQVIEEKKVERIYFWQVMSGYSAYFAEDYQEAERLFELAKNAVPVNSKWYHQIEILSFVVQLNAIDNVTEREEKKISEILVQNPLYQEYFDPEKKRRQYKYFNINFISEKLAHLYWKKGAFGKAYLCRYSIGSLKYCNDATIARAVLDFYDKPNKNAFEQFLLEKEAIQDREKILGILGTALLAEHKLVAAEEVLEKVCNSSIRIFDPFFDYLTLRQPMRKKVAWSKYEIAEAVNQLENYLQNNSSNTASTHLKLAHYHYNVSYYGHAWYAIDFYKSYSSIFGGKERFRDGFYKNPSFSWGRRNYDFLDLTRAKYHYLQVLTKTKDRELQAQAYYGLEACDKAEIEKEAESDWHKKPEYLHYYFAELACYDDTQFYADIVEECADFEWFVQ